MQLKVKEKMAYGLGDLGNNVAYGAMGFYLVFFLTDVAGIPPLWAGNIFLVIRMWNALLDMVVGTLSDKTKTKFGRRRPYLLFGAIPLSICFARLWHVVDGSMTMKILYYMVVGLLFSTTFSLVAIPYNALLPEMSQDYDERTSISGFKMAFSFIGSLLSAMGVTLIVDTLYGGKSTYGTSFPIMGWVLGAIIALSVLLAFLGTKERVVSKEGSGTGTSMIKNLKSLFQLKEYRLVLGVFMGNMIGFDIIMALYIYYMKYALKISEDISFIFMAIPLVVAVVLSPFWVSVSNRFGKQKTYIGSVIYFLVPLIVCIVLPAGHMALTVVVIILIGGGLSASQILTFSILPDVVEVDEMKNGVRREGIIYGSSMFIYKIGSALIVALVTALLGVFGYVENATEVVTQSASAITGIRLLIGLVPATCFVISAIFVSRLRLGKKDFDALKQTLVEE